MTSSIPKLAFIGGGNMAASLIGGLLAAGHPASAMSVSEPDAARAKVLADRFGIQTFTDNADCIVDVEVIVVATKPQQVASALRGLVPKAGTTVLSIAAGVRIASLLAMLGDVAVVRAMPNTPALLGVGITGLFAQPEAGDAAREHAEYVLHAAGSICWVAREELIDAVTALSGSGPAYYFLLTEALAQAGAALGLDPDTAAQLARHTLIGSARMAQDGGADVKTLRAQVTSKGGTTEAAVAMIESGGVRNILVEALAAAARRGRQMGDELAAQIQLQSD